MHRNQVCKALEVRAVEGEQMSHLMYFEHRRKMGVVDLYAKHVVRQQKPPPGRVDTQAFRKEA